MDVLQTLNNAKFSWYHVKAIAIAGVGFFTDAYDLFIINIVVPMISYAYYDGHIPTLQSSFLKGTAVFGTLIGQLLFGYFGDKLGRKKVYGISLGLIILGTLMSTLSASTVRGIGMVTMVSFWRFILGIGVGGDYPISAIFTSEYASTKTRGRMIASVFAMQGLGILSAGIVSIIVVSAFKQFLLRDPLYADYCWRICIGVGCIPALIAVYFRLKLPETPRFTLEVKGDSTKTADDIATILGNSTTAAIDMKNITPASPKGSVKRNGFSWKGFCIHFRKWKNFKVLFGCSACWFLLDIAFYGLGLNQSVVLGTIGFTKKDTAYDDLYSLAVGNTVISLMGTVPGYWLTVGLIDRIGRIRIQLIGFSVLTAVFVVLAAGYATIINKTVWLFIIIYCIGLFCFNFGPNTTTFVIPGEVFPTKFRSTAHGICAASGKIGAIIASYGFNEIATHTDGLRNLLAIFSAIMFMGLLCTFLLPETMGKSLEEISQENGEDSTDLKEPVT